MENKAKVTVNLVAEGRIQLTKFFKQAGVGVGTSFVNDSCWNFVELSMEFYEDWIHAYKMSCWAFVFDREKSCEWDWGGGGHNLNWDCPHNSLGNVSEHVQYLPWTQIHKNTLAL